MSDMVLALGWAGIYGPMALGAIGSREAAEHLRQLRFDSSASIRMAADRALREMGEKDRF